jgi:hypothetical protein
MLGTHFCTELFVAWKTNRRRTNEEAIRLHPMKIVCREDLDAILYQITSLFRTIFGIQSILTIYKMNLVHIDQESVIVNNLIAKILKKRSGNKQFAAILAEVRTFWRQSITV